MNNEAEQAVFCWFLKTVMLITDARVTRPPSTSDNAINRWFEIETPYDSRFQDLEEDIASALDAGRFFQLHVGALLSPCFSALVGRRSTWFYDRDTPLGKVAINVPRNIRSILLEEWTFTFDPTVQHMPGVRQNRDYQYQQGVMLIQSLYSFLRAMPAWILHNNLTSDQTMHIVVEASLSSVVVDNSVLKLDQKVASSDPDAIAFEFPPIINTLGKVVAQVRYRPCISFRLVPIADPESSWVALTKGEGANFKQMPLSDRRTRRRRPALNQNTSIIQPTSIEARQPEPVSGQIRLNPVLVPVTLPSVQANRPSFTPEKPTSRNSLVSFFIAAKSKFRRTSNSSSGSPTSRSQAQSLVLSETPEGSSLTSNQTSVGGYFDDRANTEYTSEGATTITRGTFTAERDLGQQSLTRWWSRIRHRTTREHAEGSRLDLAETMGDDPQATPITESSIPRTVSSTMSASEIVTVFDSQHCPDISYKLDLPRCDNIAISGGGFGDIYRGKLLSGELVAIKCPRLFLDDTQESRGVLKSAARELYAWSKCQHVCVAELLGVALFRNQLAMISRWAVNGTLPQFVSANPSTDRLRLCHQIATGLDYLHKINMVHGDIKGANILISDEGHAQLADFGSSALKHSSLEFTGESAKTGISLRWAAPELFDEVVKSSKEADVYALGMVCAFAYLLKSQKLMTFLEAITGALPYAGRSDFNVVHAVTVKQELPPRPEGIGFELWNLLLECWSRNPAEGQRRSMCF